MVLISSLAKKKGLGLGWVLLDPFTRSFFPMVACWKLLALLVSRDWWHDVLVGYSSFHSFLGLSVGAMVTYLSGSHWSGSRCFASSAKIHLVCGQLSPSHQE